MISSSGLGRLERPVVAGAHRSLLVRQAPAKHTSEYWEVGVIVMRMISCHEAPCHYLPILLQLRPLL